VKKSRYNTTKRTIHLSQHKGKTNLGITGRGKKSDLRKRVAARNGEPGSQEGN